MFFFYFELNLYNFKTEIDMNRYLEIAIKETQVDEFKMIELFNTLGIQNNESLNFNQFINIFTKEQT